MATSTTAAEMAREQYRQVVSLINGSSASSITKHGKEYLESMFEDENEEGFNVQKGSMI